MELNKYNWSDKRTIGMEIELQLLDADSLDLADAIIPLMDHYQGFPYIKPEFIQCSVEVMSEVCFSIQELEANMKSLVSNLYNKCTSLGLALSGAGTHPFCDRLAAITPLPRYLSIEERVGYPCYDYITFSTHLHVGMSSGEETISLMKLLRPYLPILLALSASSPFWRGFDTHHACYRQRVLAGARTYGLPPRFENWEHFCSFFKAANNAGVYNTFREFHWDLRPRPDFGTLEIRIMDSQPTVREAIILAAFTQSIIEYLKLYPEEVEQMLDAELPYWIEQENRFRSLQHGLDAMCVINEAGNARPIRNIVEDIFSLIEETARKLGISQQLDGIKEILSDGPSYIRQRNEYKASSSYKTVVSSVVRELETEVSQFYS